MRPTVALFLCLAALAAACAAAPAGPEGAPCAADGFRGVPALALPAAPPRPEAGSKGRPLRYAEGAPIGKSTGQVGTWSRTGNPAVWRLRLTAERASSLSVYAEPFELPPGAELWVCDPDGSVRHGPYAGRGPAGNGQLWSPVVPGAELWLELRIPDKDPRARLRLAEGFVGYQASGH